MNITNQASICFSTSNTLTNLHGTATSIQPLGTKVEMVYSLLSMLGTHGKDDMSLKLLELSSSVECCIAMRQSGCLPLLIQILHGNPQNDDNVSREADREARRNASQALHNIVHTHPDDKRGRREARVLRMLEQIREYCNAMRDLGGPIQNDENANKVDQHPGPSIAALMKLSFDEEHRHAICQLGGLQAIAELIKVDHDVHGNTSDSFCLTLRRYAGMALTNLTFGDGTNKALLCSMRPFMQALVSQLHSPNEDLRQVTASVLRNLSWRADADSKKALRSVGVVTTLIKAAMEATKESTLKSILSALWNLSAHCSNNKADICAVDGALAFLVGTLVYKSPSKTHSVIENGGGILRNISSHIALCEEYRAVLRKHRCLQTLLEHLKSPSLTIVSNACGTLWNLSARCVQDQRILWELGAVNMLRRLIHSRHKMIAMGSSAALKNLLTAKIPGTTYCFNSMYESGHFGINTPSLLVRKQRALEAEIDHNLSETYDNIDSPKNSPTHNANLENRFAFHSIQQPRYTVSLPGCIYDNGQVRSQEVTRSISHDSLGSTHSEPLYPHLQSGAFRLISRNAKFVSPDHRHYSVKIAEWKNFQLSSFKDNYLPFIKCSVLPNQSLHSSINDGNSINSEFLEKESEGMSSLNESKFINIDSINNSIEERIKLDSNELNSLEGEVETSDDDSDKSEQKNLNNSTLEVSTYKKQANHLSKLATIAQKIDFFNIEDHDTHEQPIDYSLKYREENVALISDIEEKCPHPKIDNFMLKNSPVCSYKESSSSVVKNDNNWNNNEICVTLSENVTSESCIRDVTDKRPFSETDFDNPDQPTDFSQKYTEHIDPLELYPSQTQHKKESSKLFNCSNTEITYDKSESKHYTNDDTVKIYCTEDTPLNFSTASSLTDLQDIHLSASSDTCLCLKSKDKLSVNAEREAISSSDSKGTMPFVLETTCRNSMLIEPTSYCEKKNIEKPNSDSKKEVCAVEKEGKTVTFGEEVNYAEETPLMFSRCSSLGSLSSFEQHSIQDDRSSVISDFSRRASEVVSPSDLPDSPSQTVPPSPHRDKKNIFEFKDSTALPEKMICPDESFKEKSIFEDSKTSFAEEGTPAEFSRATSLSSLTIDDDLKLPKNLDLKDKAPENKFHIDKQLIEKRTEKVTSVDSEKRHLEENSSHSSSNEFSPVGEDEKSDLSEAESTENDMLAACINSGMPNNSSYHNGHNNSKLRSKLNNLGNISRQLRTSNLPSKSNNVKLNQPVLNISKPIIYSNIPTANSNLNLHAGSFGDDSLKIYKTEDTPSNLSHATSLSDLSNVSCTESNRDVEVSKSNRDTCSDSSSLCDENDNLLLQCIQSGMPQSKKKSKEIDHCGRSSVPDVPFKSKLPFLNYRKQSDPNSLKQNVLNSPTEFKSNTFAHHKTFANQKSVMNNCCLLNQTWKNNNDEKHAKSSQTRIHQRSHSVTSVQSLSNQGDTCTFNSLSQSDSPKVYEVEGTPVNFSCNDSLSSLSCEEESDVKKEHKFKRKNLDYCSRKNEKVLKNESWLSSPTQIACLHSSIPEKCIQTYSEQKITKNHHQNEAQTYSSTLNQEKQQNSLDVNDVKGATANFSRNNSLSSLSVDSTDEPSSSEQALLEECINIGMPKDKSVKEKHGKNKSKQGNLHSKLPVRESSDQMYKSSKQKKTEDNINRGSASLARGTTFSEINEKNEEKGMEDERTKEKQKYTNFDSFNKYPSSEIQKKNVETSFIVLTQEENIDSGINENITEKYEESDHNTHSSPKKHHNIEKTDECSETSNSNHVSLSTSTVIKLEAQKVGAAIEELVEDMTQSSISCTSDIENVNPPSVMDLNISLSSNSMSEWFPNKLDSAKRNNSKRLFNNTRKHIPESVRRALAGNFDVMKISSNSDILCNIKPPSAMGSIENLSLKSSCTSDLLENVNPPSLMDDVSMIGSSISLNSVSSDILENRSHSTNNVKDHTNDIYDRLNAAAAMVEIYSREYTSLHNGSVKSSHSSDMIEHIKPPSMTHNITEVTIEDATELASDTLESDTELGEDLPCDDDTGSETLKAPNIPPLTKDEIYEGSTENLMSSFIDTDTLEFEKDECNSNNIEMPLPNMNITAEQMKVLQENAQLVVTTLNEIQMSGSSESDPDAVNSNEMIEDETLSLVSDESDDPSQTEEIETISEQYVSKMTSNNIENSEIVPTSTDKLKVLKTKPISPNASSNVARLSFSSQKNSNTSNDPILPLEKSQKPINELSKDEVIKEEEKTKSEDQSCRPKSLIKQGTFTKDKPESNTKRISNILHSKIKENKIAINDDNQQTVKINSVNKIHEKKIPVGQTRISYLARPSGIQNAPTRTYELKNTYKSLQQSTANQSVVNTKDKPDSSRSQSPNLLNNANHNGSLDNCSTSNVSLSSASSSSTLPDKSRGSVKKEVGSKVASIWKSKKCSRTYSSVSTSNKKPAVSSPATQTTGNYQYQSRKSVSSNRLQSPVPHIPSPREGLSRSSTYEKLSTNEEKTECSAEKTTVNILKSRTKCSFSWNKGEQGKHLGETSKTRTNTNVSTCKSEQDFSKDSFKIQQGSPQGSKTKISGNQCKIQNSLHYNHSISKMNKNESKPVSAVVSPFNYNPSAINSKSKSDVPSKSMIPAPKKSTGVRNAVGGIRTEENEGKRVRRTCLVTMV
ncbi:adenomatous polyposis coli protein-like [Centruroides sculpturatus]|uniref:adenomatous polyposis coli protein-like n=1 Tax=Centruroides sculpturatus TaxID=218467 RepID=UPI000C6CBFB5|nr:adenomatous polyposis coli protein-like [Centruroides sculpturatus]